MARLIGAFRQTIEVRPDEQVTKARWVRVELLKIESLPGGGNQNTYSDHVGSSPVKIWAAEGEWDVLGSVSATSRDAFFCVSLFFSKISHSPYEFPNQFRRASNLTREVREFEDYFPRTPAHNHSAGIRYVLTATLCLRSKRCVMFADHIYPLLIFITTVISSSGTSSSRRTFCWPPPTRLSLTNMSCTLHGLSTRNRKAAMS